MKAKFLIITLFTITFLTPNVFSQDADKVLGYWLTQDGDSQVKIFKAKDGKYYGNIKWLETPTREDGSIKLDDKNPNEELSKKQILGLQLLKGFSYNADDEEWEHGTIYDPKSGKTYKCFMWFDEGDDVTLHVKGFIGISVIGSRVDWTREEKLRE
ncbi:MAG: DUF2147 domain-containing protein [Bacteroidales bacterium]|nr:DUF2147 domain-containing protein [Bacteroidales bacterium]